MLAARWCSRRNDEKPVLIWLHGFLGSGEDWATVINAFSERSCITIDLPGHGDSRHIHVNGFSEMAGVLRRTLRALDISSYCLVGYSLGGRIAMYYACYARDHFLKGVAVEGGNPGLKEQRERMFRLSQDRVWAGRFRHQPIKSVLSDWYQQPVFASLSGEERERLIGIRSVNDPQALAAMLEATSLGGQPWLGEQMQQLSVPFTYLCGEKDKKFQNIAKQLMFPVHTVASAGHNAHRENPAEFIRQLKTFLSSYSI